MMANKKTLIITADGSELFLTLNQMTAAFKKMEKNSADMGVKVSRSMQGIENSAKTVTAGLKTLAAGLVITATGGGLQSILRTADSFKQLTARVNLASEGLGDAAANYAQLSKQAQTAGASLETTVSVFQRMALVAPSLQATNAEILRVTDTVQKLSVITGAGSEQMKYGLTQLGQAFGQTNIMAEEFNSLNENIPGVLKAVADQMGVTTGELRTMQREGKLASKDFFEALLAASAKADEAFTKMPLTIERATNSIRISFTNMVGKFDEATGATSTLAKGMVSLSKGFDDTMKGVEAVSKAYADHKVVVDALVLALVGGGGLLLALRAIPIVVPAIIGGIASMTAGLGGLLVGVSALINPVGVLVASLGALAGIRVAELIQQGQSNVRAGEMKAAQGQVQYQKARLDPNYLKTQIASLQGQKAKLGKVGLGQSTMAIDAQIADFQGQLARLEGRGLKAPALNIPKVSLPTGGAGGGGGRGRAGSRAGGRGATAAAAEREFVATRIDPLSDYMESLFERSNSILESLKTPFDTFNGQVAELDLLAKHNLISFDQFTLKLAEYRQELDATLPASEALTGVWEDYANAAGTASTAINDLQQVTVNVGTEFANMVASGKVSFADLANSLLRDLARVAIQLKIVTPLMNSVFGAQGQGGGLLSQLGVVLGNSAKGFSMPGIRGLPTGGGGAPIPAFANGGMPPVGRPVLVGERGAELVTFGQQARVHSNQASKGILGGGGSNVVVNIHNAPEGTKAQRSNQGGVDVIDVVLARVAGQIASGSGAIPKALNTRFGLNPAMGNG